MSKLNEVKEKLHQVGVCPDESSTSGLWWCEQR